MFELLKYICKLGCCKRGRQTCIPSYVHTYKHTTYIHMHTHIHNYVNELCAKMCALKQVMQDFITLTHLVFQIPVVCRPLGHLCSSNHHHRLYPIHHLCTLQLCPRRVMSHQPDECHHEYNLLSKQISQCSTFSA